MDNGPDHTKVVRRRILVRGRVQGVFYRETLRREAEGRGVSGSATNIEDGSVECFFEGNEHSVNAMIDVARVGSKQAEPEITEMDPATPTGKKGFIVA